jgi:4-hydroxy-3-methylbut-2-enyl diphosphate reductase IspH
MHTIMASHAGFCAGVKRAFKMTEEMAGHPGKWYTWGPLVHNQTVVDYFSRQGIRPIEDIDDISEPAGLIIRSHGVAPEIIEEARNNKTNLTRPLTK